MVQCSAKKLNEKKKSIKCCTRELTYLIYILPVVVYREINIVHGLWIVVGTDTPLDDTINVYST